MKKIIIFILCSLMSVAAFADVSTDGGACLTCIGKATPAYTNKGKVHKPHHTPRKRIQS